jgi:glycosyltransferase involved in cell wall biosynthesis
MKFSIITPTFKRKELLERAVSSLQAQTYKDWEILIVNDSPYDTTYKEFASKINDQRIRYFVNDTNKGVNYSRNFALERISADSKWVIFLDDDDYLSPDTLAYFYGLIRNNPEQKWFVTNRALKNGIPLTSFPHDDTLYSYSWQYLILKRCKGDATHCIESKLITSTHSRFSSHIKQGEEWFFFYQIGSQQKIFYSNHNSTISDGYDISSGLNFRKRTRGERFETIVTLLYEGLRRETLPKLTFILYLFARLLLILKI